jgi:hypothetical protein
MRKKTTLFTTAALLSAAGLAHGQITVESVFNYNDNNADNLEGVGVFNASAFDKLVVIVSGESGNPLQTSGRFLNGVTYDGVAMNAAVIRDGLPEVNGNSPDQLFNHIYYLDNPFGNTGTIEVDTNLSRLAVTMIGLDGTAEGLGATAISGLSAKSIDFTTTNANSYIIAANGLGGTGNNGNVEGLTTNTPLSLLSAVETNGNYVGHMVGGTTVETPSTSSYSFTGGTAGSHVLAAEFLLGPPPPLLTLRANTTNGVLTMIGDDGEAISISYYEISSAGNSLNTANWNSLADQDYDGNGPADGSGNGWEEAGGSSSSSLAEAYLLGDSEFGVSQQVQLGRAYDTAVDARDLSMRFLTDTGKIRDGEIEYFSPLLGDANNDGEVSLLDLDILGQNYGSLGEWADGDFNGDGQVSLVDLDILGANYGNTTTPLSQADMLAYIEQSVPEPGSLALLGVGGLLLARRRNYML